MLYIIGYINNASMGTQTRDRLKRNETQLRFLRAND